jgi:hypothetical protein
MLEDCRVFHDFPSDKKWNIDHIVVAPDVTSLFRAA